ncbi:MAG: protein-L-isoaspartate(D-aspartate) O-methyltransferase, partial [candidate division Zixibacteria bacterium]
ESKCSEADSVHLARRIAMIETQLIARGISDKHLLKAFETVERHKFVPPELQPMAYYDYPLPIEADQTISQPYIVALMTELLQLKDGDRVLEIGTGSGYQSAILAELAEHVYTIEIIDTLANQSKKLLHELGYDNISVRSGDGFAGWPDEAPFDSVIVTCAPPEIPTPLIDQLAEGGRLIIPVGIDWQELILVEKTDGKLKRKEVIPVRFVPMTGEAQKK